MKRQLAKYALLSCVVASIWAIACSPDAPGILPPPPSLPPPPPTSPPGYDVIDLGTLGGASARPLALNDSGQVVGSSQTAAGDWHAFLWDNGVMRDLGLPYATSKAEGITNSRVISGVGTTTTEQSRVFRWNAGSLTELGTVYEYTGDRMRVVAMTAQNVLATYRSEFDRSFSTLWRNGTKQDLDGLEGHSESGATAMNGRGQIVGASLVPGPAVHDVHHAYIWEDGAIRDLGVLQHFDCDIGRDCGAAWATDLNSTGDVVGHSIDSAYRDHAVLWPRGGADGSIRDLGLWTPVAINEAGDIAGHRMTSDTGIGFFWRNGTLTSVGSLGGRSTSVVDMNDQSTVVGTSLTALGVPHAFVWKPGQGAPTDLAGAGDVGTVAVAVNSRGDVLGHTCSAISHGVCSSFEPHRAILWRVKP
ncbi:MAG TPA: hypothetical protein VFO67_07200 [Gemmatimonadales bacterium]|nr:hypothetical protein [Gemmatimonadales bacterium]